MFPHQVDPRQEGKLPTEDHTVDYETDGADYHSPAGRAKQTSSSWEDGDERPEKKQRPAREKISSYLAAPEGPTPGAPLGQPTLVLPKDVTMTQTSASEDDVFMDKRGDKDVPPANPSLLTQQEDPYSSTAVATQTIFSPSKVECV